MLKRQCQVNVSRAFSHGKIRVDDDNDNDLFSKLTEQANEIFTETTLYIYICYYIQKH